MSDTPRTNFVAHETGDAEWDRSINRFGRMMAHACILERENVALRDELKDCSAQFDLQQEQLDRNAEKIAILRDVLSRLIKVHDAMGGKCGTVRIAAEEALLGKAQSEYICTCGIRVTPHKCPTDNDF